MRTKTQIKVIILAIGLAASLPVIFGILLYQQQIACMNTWAEKQGVKVTEVTYQRSWRHSSSEYQLYYPFSEIPSELHAFFGAMTLKSPAYSPGLELIARYEWEHGPWFFGKLARGHLKILLPLGVSKEPILLATIQMNVQWNGAVKGDFDISQLKLQTQDEAHTLMIGKGAGDFKYRSDVHWHTHIQLDALAYEEYQLPLYRLESLSIDKHQAYYPAIDWLGSSHLKLNELKFMMHQNPWLLKKISSETNTQLVGKNINVNWLANIGSIMLDQGRYGPLQIEVSAENIDPAAWKTGAQLIKSFSQNNATFVTLQEISGFSDFIAQWMSQEPQVALNHLSIQTPQGEVKLHGTLNTKMLPKSTEHTTADWLQALQLKLDIVVSKKLLESLMLDYSSQRLKQSHPEWNTEQLQVGAQQSMMNLLQIWLEKQWIVEKDNQYQLNIHFENAILRLNNQIVSSADFRMQS